MPFAKKFRAMMDIPFPGATVGEFEVEDVDVHDEWGAPEGYAYGVQMVLRGPGGKQAVQRALKSLFTKHPTTFSGYGNPYQLWFGKPEIESLGDQRYEVNVKGSGARIYLEPDLARFLKYLDDHHHLAAPPDSADHDALIENYLDQYRAEIALLVARYHRKLSKSESKIASEKGAEL